jgi:putative two-component system response regulator
MKFLIAEDNPSVSEVLKVTLESQRYAVDIASNGKQALTMARNSPPDMIISDILMPEMDGFMLCRAIKEDARLSVVPFIFYSATYQRNDDEQLAMELGASAFIRKPIAPSDFLKAINDVISQYQSRKLAIPSAPGRGKAKLARMHEHTVVRKLGEKVIELDRERKALQSSNQNIQTMYRGVIGTISKVMEFRDRYTTGHEQRVARLASAVAIEMGLGEKRVEGVFMGGAVHDIGKICIPAELLTRPKRLSFMEYELIKGHSEAGYDILKGISFPWPVADIALQHHERIDGSGYPRGIGKDEICIEARVIAVADVVEAMSSHRPYRPAKGVEAALEEIREQRGKYYDPEVVDATLAVFREGNFSFF